MSAVDFEIAFDGDAVRDGTMDVRQLAPALLALGDLITQTNRVLNGEAADVSVKIKTGTKAGSFPVEMALLFDPTTTQHLVDFALSDGIQLLSTLGFIKVGGKSLEVINNLPELLRQLRGRRITERRELEDGNIEVTVTGDNNDVPLVVNSKVDRVARDGRARKAVEGVMRPLENAGVDEFQVRSDKGIIERVARDEIEYYRASPAGDDPLHDDLVDSGEYERWVTVKKNWNEPGNKFTFEMGDGGTISAEVVDQSFWERVERDEIPPTKHALFRFRFEWEQHVDRSGVLETTNTATKLLEYRAPPPPPNQQQETLELGEIIAPWHSRSGERAGRGGGGCDADASAA